MEPIRWGVLSTAKIGLEKVLPAMAESPDCEIVAIASRDLAKANAAADELGIARRYGSYQEIFDDPEVDAIYNPLPNDLHVPLSIEAANAGKHVLCEKPIGLDADEAKALLEARDANGVAIVEAFMVRHHPQWLRTRDLLRSGALGTLLSVHAAFSYFNDNPDNIRNIKANGGGGLYDIGVYPIVVSRYLFEREPNRVVAAIERDPNFGTDRLTSALLDFGGAHATFVCSTQMVPYQRVQVLGSRGRIEIQIPFNAPPDAPTRLFTDDGSALGDGSAKAETFDVCDQYRLQGEAFARILRGEAECEFPLEDSIANMRVVDALFRSADTGQWVEIG